MLVKLSGEAMSGGGLGFEADRLRKTAEDLAEAAGLCDIAVVTGGGNIVRGAALAERSLLRRESADQMGMLGTLINGIALRDALTLIGVPCRLMTASPASGLPGIAEPIGVPAAEAAFAAGEIVILAGGTGQPFFTTDTGSTLRAVQLECEAVLKATKVDGVYDSDPMTNPNATRFRELTIQEALDRELGIMDLTAMTMCKEHGISAVVFDFNKPGNLSAVIRGEDVGTVVHAQAR